MPIRSVLRSPLRSVLRPTIGEGVGVLNLDAYLASLSGGLHFDTSKLDRYFQDFSSTLADDVGEAIGLALDQRSWAGKTLAQIVSEQPELVPATAFSVGTTGGTSAWVEGPAGTITGTFDGTNIAFARGRDPTCVVGRLYRISVEQFVAPSVTNLAIRVGTTLGGAEIASFNLSTATGVQSFYFIASATGVFIQIGGMVAVGGVALRGLSVKLVPGNHGSQTSGTLRPVRQAAGAKFDGSDDNWLTPYLAGAASNFIVALVTLPASSVATQVIAGLRTASTTRFFLSASANVISGGVGANSTGVIVSTAGAKDSQRLVCGISCDGSQVRLFDDNALVYEAAQSGVVATGTPARVGSLNDNGTANNFFAGAVEELVFGQGEHLTLARYQQIRSALLAA